MHVMAETLDETRTAKRKWCSLYCGHCQSKVPKSTFYRHKAQFYDGAKKKWILKNDSGELAG